MSASHIRSLQRRASILHEFDQSVDASMLQQNPGETGPGFKMKASVKLYEINTADNTFHISIYGKQKINSGSLKGF